MRSRNIKPGFFKNEDLADSGPYARLLFAGLWCMADKAGRLEDRPRRIKAEIFPYDDKIPSIDTMLNTLAKLDMIIRYKIENRRYIQVVNFLEHQRPHHTERESTVPPPEINGCITVNSPLSNGGNPPDSLIPDSLIPDSLIPDSKVNDLSTAEPVDDNGTIKISSLAQLWNENRPPELAQVNIPFTRTPKKLKPLQDAIKRNPTKVFWLRIIEKIHYSSFLRGKNKNGWKATFDFIVDKANEIDDGKYIDAGGANQTEQTINTAYNWAKKREAQREPA